MEETLITVGITCYNAEDTILRAIGSALDQSYSNFEIIVIDDGSSDNSVHVISEFIQDKPKIRLVCHEENKGFPAALNTLVAEAKGEYIAFFDDDDVSVPERLALQSQRIRDFEKIVKTDRILCYSNRTIVKAGQNKPDHIALGIGRKSPEPFGMSVADFILWHTHDRKFVWGLFGSCTLMTKVSLLKDIGGFDESFRRSAEMDMAVRAAGTGAHFIAVDKPLITQFKTPTSDKSGKIPLKFALQLRKKHAIYLKKKGVYWAAICLTNYQYNQAKRNRLIAYLWMLGACFLAPRKILWEKLAAFILGKIFGTRHRHLPSGVFSQGIK